MLGAARASEYAGWWSGGNPSVTFTTTSDLAYTNFQTPSFSLLSGVGSSPAGSWNIIGTGNYDLTGYTTLTNYNVQRSTIIFTCYIPWPTSGIPSAAFVGYTLANELEDNSSVLYYNPILSLTNSNTNLQITQGVPGGNQTLTLSGGYAQYMNRWLTIVCSSSETQNSYTSWDLASGGGSSGAYCRTAVFDTELGTLIDKRDFRNTWSYPALGSFPTTTPANTSSGAYGLDSNAFGSGPDSGGTYYNVRFSNFWLSIGTMFDPLTTTNTTWRTTRPSGTIDTGVAWQNLQLTNYEFVSPGTYYVTTQGQDLYSQANNRAAKTDGWSGTQWTNNYSDTLITKDSG